LGQQVLGRNSQHRNRAVAKIRHPGGLHWQAMPCRWTTQNFQRWMF
jgi:hypothetical protein